MSGLLSSCVAPLAGCVDFETKLTLAEFTSIVLTLVVAIGIPVWLQGFVEKRTRLKGSVGRIAEQAFDTISSIQGLLEKTRDDTPMDEATQRHDVIASLKSCSNRIALLESALRELGYLKKLGPRIDALKRDLLNYKKVVTSRAMPTVRFVPTPDQISKSRKAYRDFGAAYFRLIAQF